MLQILNESKSNEKYCQYEVYIVILTLINNIKVNIIGGPKR